MRKLLLFVCIIAVAVALGACGRRSAGTGQNASKPVKVAFITNNVSDFWTIARAGCAQAEKDFNVKCEFRMPPQGTATEQKSILEDLMVTGISGVAISPVNPANQTDILNKAAEHMNLICHDSDAPTSKRLCYVGTVNYTAGTIAGEQLKKVLPDGGKVMLFVGTLDAENARERNNGLRDAVKGTKIQILGTLTDNADHTRAKSNVEDVLVKYPDIGALVGLWAYNGPAIAEAVKAAGKQGKVKIVCFDEFDATLQGIKDGVIHATIVQKPYEFGYQSLRILAALARNEDPGIPENKLVDTGVDAITKENVEEFWANLKKLTGKS